MNPLLAVREIHVDYAKITQQQKYFVKNFIC